MLAVNGFRGSVHAVCTEVFLFAARLFGRNVEQALLVHVFPQIYGDDQRMRVAVAPFFAPDGFENRQPFAGDVERGSDEYRALCSELLHLFGGPSCLRSRVLGASLRMHSFGPCDTEALAHDILRQVLVRELLSVVAGDEEVFELPAAVSVPDFDGALDAAIEQDADVHDDRVDTVSHFVVRILRNVPCGDCCGNCCVAGSGEGNRSEEHRVCRGKSQVRHLHLLVEWGKLKTKKSAFYIISQIYQYVKYVAAGLPIRYTLSTMFRKYYLRAQWLFNYVRSIYHLLSVKELERVLEHAPTTLNKKEHKIYSQHGEDGLIDEIFKRIGTTSKTFFEFGAGSGVENNTISLLIDGWKGWWIDGGDYVDVYKKLYATSIANGKLTIGKHLISSKNINEIVQTLGIPKEIDFLSLDIDGNDYYVWEALSATTPRVIAIEYNGAYLPDRHFLQKESENLWNGSNFFGASLFTLNELAKKKGYTLVCCDSSGANAFFVRNDVVGNKFEYAGEISVLWQKPRYYISHHGGHMPTINYGEVPAMGEWIPKG